jgi:hypothetical protein
LGLGFVAAVALVLVSAQLVLPGIAAQRVHDQVSPFGNVRSVSVSALPAIELLWGDAGNVSVTAGDLRLTPSQMVALVWSAHTVDRVEMTAAGVNLVGLSLGEGELPLHDVKFSKRGNELIARASMRDGELRETLSNSLQLQGLVSSGGRPEVAVRGDVLGTWIYARAVIVAIEGRIAAELVGAPFADISAVTLFRDPRVWVQSVSASARAGGDELAIRARLAS